MITLLVALFLIIIGLLWVCLLENATGLVFSMVPYALIVFAAWSIFYISRYSLKKYLKKIVFPLALTAFILVLMYLLVIKVAPDTWCDSYTFLGRIWEMFVKLVRAFFVLFVITLMFVIGGIVLFFTIKMSLMNSDEQTSWKNGQSAALAGLYLVYFAYRLLARRIYFGLPFYIAAPFVVELLVLWTLKTNVKESLPLSLGLCLGVIVSIVVFNFKLASRFMLGWFVDQRSEFLFSIAFVVALFILPAIVIGFVNMKKLRCYDERAIVNLCILSILFFVPGFVSLLSHSSLGMYITQGEFGFAAVAMLVEAFVFAAASFSLKQAIIGAFMPLSAILSSRLYWMFCAGNIKSVALYYLKSGESLLSKMKNFGSNALPFLFLLFLFLVPAIVIGLSKRKSYDYGIKIY